VLWFTAEVARTGDVRRSDADVDYDLNTFDELSIKYALAPR
jgi:hypothetical protein